MREDRTITVYDVRKVKMTRLALAYIDVLEKNNASLFTDYNLFLKYKDVYKNPEGLYIRNTAPTIANYKKTRKLLIESQKIARDADYPSTYRLLSKQDLPADEVVCLVDPFCYISHLSAMQRYGLTNRRPDALFITTPAAKIIKAMFHEKMAKDYNGELNSIPSDQIYPLKQTHHPVSVRKRPLEIFSTVGYGESIQLKGSFARISTIGQTFLDMLEEPQRCGGMAHVLDVWEEHARKYIDEIISTVDKTSKDIYKVRAGYILNELLRINRPEITKWLNYAQRGGSRVLDPSKPYINKFSEKWMLSINV